MTGLDFRRTDKRLYEPGLTPSLVDVPTMRFITVEGRGNPNTAPAYAGAIETLYGLSYTIKMSRKGPVVPPGYVEYSVGPLEGLWWFEGGQYTGTASVLERKDDFCWLAMIRQPEFVTPEVFEWACEAATKKKRNLDVTGARLEDITEGLCAQVMHVGPYDDEPATVAALEAFIEASGHRGDMSAIRH